MKHFSKILPISLIIMLVVTGCGTPSHREFSIEEVASEGVLYDSDESSKVSTDKKAEKDNEGIQSRPGMITAGEWNDLDNWTFWQKTVAREDFMRFPSYWGIYTFGRVSVHVSANEQTPVINAIVKLIRNKAVIATARTDNKGNAELWIGLLQSENEVDYSALQLEINGEKIKKAVKPYAEGINHISLTAQPVENTIEVALVVDATGSMADELEYLKTELVDVIGKVKENKPGMTVRTSAVFYRDKGDDYITKVSDFADDVTATSHFIQKQSADGGGDFPEAVHTALEKALDELSWSENARTRIMFLLLDAPPHHQKDVLASLHQSTQKAMEKGIKIIPVVASGIDKETEFLMRFLALATNGTYVFITDHSGIGNSHLEASVGEYQVEYLNALMVRLINKYAE